MAPGAERPRFQIHITRGLIAGFGELVLLAVVSVLALGLWSAWQNTSNLLRDKSESTIALVQSRIERHLQPAEDQLVHLGSQIERGDIDSANEADLGKYLSGALAATPQVRSVVFIRADARMVFALRRPDGVDLTVVDVSRMPVIRNALDAGRDKSGLHWAEVVHPETAQTTLVNVRYSVHRAGRYLGLLAATVRVDRLSDLLDETARTLNGVAFILYDDQYLLAHPRLMRDRTLMHPDQPLPTIEQVGDPVIEAYVRRPALAGRRARVFETTGIRIVEAAGTEYGLLARRSEQYGDTPWVVGVYFPAANLMAELVRLRWAAIAGLVVLGVALVVAYAFARYLSAPLRRLALAANHIRDLSFDRVQQLPSSLFAELTDTARAFNSMVVGLRWFETYVPRNLVLRLVRQGDSSVHISVAREATVIFTDIHAFTRQSEAMSAPETAAFLNQHFAMLSRCIEAEGGTIDKFIGDAVMAFWGAPEAQPDHAQRACQAALAIRAALAADNAERRAAGGEPIRVRIGLHTGDVIVGNIGAPGRINYSIVGDTVNIANRLEQLGKEIGGAAEVTILASGTTVRAAGDAVSARAVGAQRIRGRAGEIEVFEL